MGGGRKRFNGDVFALVRVLSKHIVHKLSLGKYDEQRNT